LDFGFGFALVLGIKSILCVIFRDKKSVFVMCGIQSSVVWNLATPFSGLRLLEISVLLGLQPRHRGAPSSFHLKIDLKINFYVLMLWVLVLGIKSILWVIF